MELEIVELAERQDEIVVDRLQPSPMIAGAKRLGFHEAFHPLRPL
ncbi:MAG TPA: hypothetical protein VFW19_00220 [Allosphingosinicella sp.]|nr:hypothetical protein [Allosphingosinicella sp.]